jgi:hypothetical protein
MDRILQSIIRRSSLINTHRIDPSLVLLFLLATINHSKVPGSDIGKSPSWGFFFAYLSILV